MSDGSQKVNPPPQRSFLPVIEHTKKIYILWVPTRRNIPRTERFGVGGRIDTLFLELLELLREAAYASIPNKILLITKALKVIDLLRFFLQLAWEASIIHQSHYLPLAEGAEEIGKMVGGWRKGLITKTPAGGAGERRE